MRVRDCGAFIYTDILVGERGNGQNRGKDKSGGRRTREREREQKKKKMGVLREFPRQKDFIAW